MKALYTKNVAIHNCLNGFILKALTKPDPISLRLAPIYFNLRGE